MYGLFFIIKQVVASLSMQSMLFRHFTQEEIDKHMGVIIQNSLLIYIFTWTSLTTWTNPMFIRACAVQVVSMMSTLAPRPKVWVPRPYYTGRRPVFLHLFNFT